VTFASTIGLAQSVPATIQASLLAKLESYDRGFPARAQGTARVFIVTKPSDADSGQEGAEMKAALSHLKVLGGLPHEEVVVQYPGAAALAQRCRTEHASVVYFTSGFDSDVEAVSAAFSSGTVLTAGSVSGYVPKGIVLGFALESGSPKISINLAQARRQGVDFPAEVLRLMTVYR
jgi:hypothetical protein